ncbi:MAG: hypothetical protein P9M03_08230 [Candidatus Theseobacter exili]|nr:hypothetical protein [Candidatus Theseobacter exili]
MDSNRLYSIYEKLHEAYGSQKWWPGDTSCEIMIGAVLTQNTSWKNVEKAIENLKKNNLLDWQNILSAPIDKIGAAIRSSGYYNQKSERLKILAEWALTIGFGVIVEDEKSKIDKLRDSLLALKGIGPETADSILLYAYEVPVFVVDAYTKRVLNRHNIFKNVTEYEEIRKYFEENLPRDIKVYNEFHALFVKLCKEKCLKKQFCDGCPLETDLIDCRNNADICLEKSC